MHLEYDDLYLIVPADDGSEYIPIPAVCDNESNAAFIVRAVNAHADLLAACEAANALLSDCGPVSGPMGKRIADVERTLRAAIQKAKESQ